ADWNAGHHHARLRGEPDGVLELGVDRVAARRSRRAADEAVHENARHGDDDDEEPNFSRFCPLTHPRLRWSPWGGQASRLGARVQKGPEKTTCQDAKNAKDLFLALATLAVWRFGWRD